MWKKNKLFIFTLTFAILMVAIIVGFVINKRISIIGDDQTSSEAVQVAPQDDQQAKIDEQLRQLNEMQKQQNAEPPTQEQIDEQLRQLEEIQKQQNAEPPTQEQIDEQLRQLDALQKANGK